jgi:hypothetical protein
MTRRRLVAGAIVVLLAAARQAGAQTQASADALTRWAEAVRTHEPGKPDAGAAAIAALKYSDRLALLPSMQLFLASVLGEPVAVNTDPQRQVVNLVATLKTAPGFAAFLERAAVAHADAVFFADRFPALTEDAPPPKKTGEPPPALLSNERFTLHVDGRVVGETPGNWNWPFARSLLDLLLHPRPSGPAVTDHDRAFIAEWYHAVDAYLLATGHHGDLRLHLDHASNALPDSAPLLFDRACYTETLGLSLYQSLQDSAGLANAQGRVQMGVPSEGTANGDAEWLFRRALEADPDYVEARVRLARLIGRRRRDEAAAQIDKALAASHDRTVTFFAHLVAGRIAESGGHASDALAHYTAAAALYPDAQSALLGASHAAVMAGDLAAAHAFVARLSERSLQFESDPWWNYHLGPGRDVDALVGALWSHTPR